MFFHRSFLIEEKCRFLSNFSLKTAEVELPGEFLIPRVRKIYKNQILLILLFLINNDMNSRKQTFLFYICAIRI